MELKTLNKEPLVKKNLSSVGVTKSINATFHPAAGAIEVQFDAWGTST